MHRIGKATGAYINKPERLRMINGGDSGGGRSLQDAQKSPGINIARILVAKPTSAFAEYALRP
jgi:hypothetical protein